MGCGKTADIKVRRTGPCTREKVGTTTLGGQGDRPPGTPEALRARLYHLTKTTRSVVCSTTRDSWLACSPQRLIAYCLATAALFVRWAVLQVEAL